MKIESRLTFKNPMRRRIQLPSAARRRLYSSKDSYMTRYSDLANCVEVDGKYYWYDDKTNVIYLVETKLTPIEIPADKIYFIRKVLEGSI